MKIAAILVLTTVTFSPSPGYTQEPELANATAQAALEEYRAAVEAAKATFVESLNDARREALDANELDEADEIVRLAAALNAQNTEDLFDPFERLKNELIWTTWRFDDGKQWEFIDGSRVRETGGTHPWAVVDEHTIAISTNPRGNGNIHLWYLVPEHNAGVMRRYIFESNCPSRRGKEVTHLLGRVETE